MSVFTTVTADQMRAWLRDYTLGELRELKGIASGITNTNYFVTTDHGQFVLTLFEHHSAEELPFFLNLMAHLAGHGIACPHPIANRAGNYLGWLNGKPAALVSRLRGAALERPGTRHCAMVGEFLARLHLAAMSYHAVMENPRGPRWWQTTAEAVMPYLDTDSRDLLQHELSYQTQYRHSALPRGVIHADLFRDNVLFDGERLGGAIDFYYACNDAWAYDLAITVNDWCVTDGGALATDRLNAMLHAYHAVRPLSREEHQAWPALLRAGALRFWLSRLYDYHFPKQGEMTHAKDPEHFRRILEARIREEDMIRDIWV
jgi:homoserine kinase type II